MVKERKTYSADVFFHNIIREVAKKYRLSESAAFQEILRHFVPLKFARWQAQQAAASLFHYKELKEGLENQAASTEGVIEDEIQIPSRT